MPGWKIRAEGRGGMVADHDELRRAVGLFAHTDGWFEIRSLTSGAHRTLPGDNLDGIVNAVEELPSGIGIYFIVNPLKPGLTKSATNRDVVARRFIYIDIDPVKQEQYKDQPASDVEKSNVIDVADSVIGYLHQCGWPHPIITDSGNGYGLFYRCDLPNDAITQQTIRRLLHVLDKKFSSQHGKIDKSIHNAARLAKLPGTWAKKGVQSDDRPHRPCKLIDAPGSFEIVTFDMLQSAIGVDGQPEYEPKSFSGTNGDLSAYGRKALESECGRVLLGAQHHGGDGRNNALNKAAFNLGQLVGGNVLFRGTVEEALFEAACRAGLDSDQGCGERGIRNTIRSGIESGIKQPRSAPEKNDPKAKMSSRLVEEAKAGTKSLTVKLSAVQPQRVEWLIKDRIPKRFITVFAGRTSVGKSFVACDLIARLSVGGEIPGGDGECFAPGGTLILSEDSHEYVLAPRLIAMGADLHRINAMTWEAMGSYWLGNTDMLEQACKEVEGGVSLVMIDPPTNFLDDVDEHKNSEVRQLVMKVVEWCFGRDLACLFVLHVNKQTGKGIDAINRVMGSVAWVTTARVAHTLCEDPNEPDRCLWVPMKNNLGPMPKGLAYRIEGPRDEGHVTWLGEVDTTANEAMDGGKRERRDVVASKWLIERFRERLEWDSDELFKAAREANVSRNAVFEAKKLLSLPTAKKIVQENGDIKYRWWVPDNWGPLQDAGTPGTPE